VGGIASVNTSLDARDFVDRSAVVVHTSLPNRNVLTKIRARSAAFSARDDREIVRGSGVAFGVGVAIAIGIVVGVGTAIRKVGDGGGVSSTTDSYAGV
jgi:hypothetical protein